MRVAITGGIGSGKSTLASLLEQRGAALVDTDAIARALSAPGGAAIESLRTTFGPTAIDSDGALDRAWMRARAFADLGARTALEALLHPLIRSYTDAQTEAAEAAGAPYVLVAIPLLAESGGAWRFDRVLVVDCTEATQVARASARPGMDATTARSIIEQQAKRAQRLALADDVVFNEGTLADLAAHADRLHACYTRLSHRTAA